MARPRVFVSSTFYDLKHIRASLKDFIESLGFETVLFEVGQVPYAPDVPLSESCYHEVGNADMYVLIIGGRYGSNASGEAGTTKGFYEVYDSVTRQEYLVASQRGIPTYVLVDQSVYADYENFTKNRDNSSFTYAHVDSVNVFRLLEHILRQRLNNPVFPFTRFSDIEAVLREQWSGHFRDLLARASSQRQLHSLNDQVNHLSEISATLKRYMESIMVNVSPAESPRLIEEETGRLNQAEALTELRNSRLFAFLKREGLPERQIIEALRKSQSLAELTDILGVRGLPGTGKPHAITRRPEANGDFEQAKKLVAGVFTPPDYREARILRALLDDDGRAMYSYQTDYYRGALDSLMERGYVERDGKGFSLTPLGKQKTSEYLLQVLRAGRSHGSS